MTIYLAGKVSGRKHEIARQLTGAEFKCTDGGSHSEHNFGFSQFDLEGLFRNGFDATVRESFSEEFEECQFLFAYIDEPTCFGTIAEVGFAAGRGVRCFVFINESDDWQGGDKNEPPEVGFDRYWFMCCLPNVRVSLVKSEAQARDMMQLAIDAIGAVA